VAAGSGIAGRRRKNTALGHRHSRVQRAGLATYGTEVRGLLLADGALPLGAALAARVVEGVDDPDHMSALSVRGFRVRWGRVAALTARVALSTLVPPGLPQLTLASGMPVGARAGEGTTDISGSMCSEALGLERSLSTSARGLSVGALGPSRRLSGRHSPAHVVSSRPAARYRPRLSALGRRRETRPLIHHRVSLRSPCQLSGACGAALWRLARHRKDERTDTRLGRGR
jgi:hypothetical protein